ncbi:DUF4846 domain-containing protein [Flavobacterium johnsoniae]|uniref:DUF4846 domain-containing protein n=1 Tax=Flavobacterium johnsoniae (strain ATCC 17061 / DSM 2064 / JCM 8514 / BCRC 14874 / CCUG 350202 / NBRC 14942 / NCIMB 11054 / UW101) TaxID=376686 RepID=A5FFW0_FLAJ1|nr:DUF4846 domain-containing protein [Flavobacterium johnsoniae]ABQ05908.1 hypothetical protein Fjoh_2887 [Flavobacterium johnsoniae UW101]OXE95526.1 hypothetical protein B0A63_24220 [Flavobacterium johnsoniae UW101]WQG81644.1 DUF4846 domain-containing protein [Flavobacterium johnsoniae UW101]SHK59685.1 protein of unknown function (4846) [Flavobacterium johnsoniae]
MKVKFFFIAAILMVIFCFFSFSETNNTNKTNLFENTIQQRFQLPQGFVREEESKTSFDYFLRNLPLKPLGSNVLYFDGTTKPNRNVYEAVVDLPIGKQDLHQCADAVMRLRADYFYSQKQYDKIHFNFTNGFRADFSKWAAGYRIAIKGNKTSWIKTAKPSDSYETYWKYLEKVFMYAGTASLEKELKPINALDIKIGDVFIKGGFPGHAVIVVDMAVNPKNNQKIMLLAQSYMPAQEIQILKNPNNSSLSPWYAVDFGTSLQTPEWTFSSSQLKRF